MLDWTDEIIDVLRSLWAEGFSTNEIARRVGMTKNAIVGKSHRLGLPSRPSPSRRDPDAAPRQPRPSKAPKTTLPPLPSSAGPEPISAPAPIIPPSLLWRPPPVIMAPARPCPEPVAKPYGRIIECCWPIGEPGTKGFHSCGVKSLPGRPYCEDHVAIAYVRVRDRREDAA